MPIGEGEIKVAQQCGNPDCQAGGVHRGDNSYRDARRCLGLPDLSARTEEELRRRFAEALEKKKTP